MSIETMKLALEALEQYADNRMGSDYGRKAITALRAAIEQAEKQEPVAYWRHESYVKSGWAEFSTEMASDEDTPLYTAPPQRKQRTYIARKWQGLTENEIKHLWYEACQTNLELTSQLIMHLARNIEAKLKEKNT